MREGMIGRWMDDAQIDKFKFKILKDWCQPLCFRSFQIKAGNSGILHSNSQLFTFK